MICDVDYIRVGSDCKPCPGGSDITGAVFSLLGICCLLMVVVFVVVYKTKAPKQEEQDDALDLERDHFTGELIILMSYMQILSGLARTYGGAVEYPESYVGFTNSMMWGKYGFCFCSFCSCIKLYFHLFFYTRSQF